MKRVKKVIWEKSGRGTHETKERNKERKKKEVKATVLKLCAVVPHCTTGYFKILFFFLPIYVYYSFKWLLRC